ncbi:hypothetical protein R6Q57_005291 [Mikania cordata]
MVKVILACISIGDKSVAEFMAKYIKDINIIIDVYLGNTLIDFHRKYRSVGLAREVFNQMKEHNVVSSNPMISGYVKAGALIDMRELFVQMPKQDIVTWTTMITGYSQCDQFSDSLSLFLEMMKTNIKPDEITITNVLSACARLGSMDMGNFMHDYIRKNNIKEYLYVRNALIDIHFRTCCEWNVIYALELFSKMLMENIQPTHGTFVGILLACAHAGMVDEGLAYFESMKQYHNIKPHMKHHRCIVDLFSRSGNLDKAYEFMVKMPKAPDMI